MQSHAWKDFEPVRNFLFIGSVREQLIQVSNNSPNWNLLTPYYSIWLLVKKSNEDTGLNVAAQSTLSKKQMHRETNRRECVEA